jgi:cytochrome subunit of sulfide dehydrogenase
MGTVRSFAAIVAIVVCGGSSVFAAPEPPPGASSCSGCHAASPAVDTVVPRLVGRSAADIVAQMQAFKVGQKQSTVMERIAKGFSEPEIQAIADWYAQQK